MRSLFPIVKNKIAFILSITLISLFVTGCRGRVPEDTVTSVPVIDAESVALAATVPVETVTASPAAEATLPAEVRDERDRIPPCYQICPVEETLPAEPADQPPIFGAGISWEWRAFIDPANGETPIDDAAHYSFILSDDGLAILNGDCRSAEGVYIIDGNALTLSYDLPTKSDDSCEEGPNEEMFFQLMQHATSYLTQDDRLFINLRPGEGKLAFDRQ